MVNKNFYFILRVVNPCIYTRFASNSNYDLNQLIVPTVPVIITTVLIGASTTFLPFYDVSSMTDTTTADSYLLCGPRTYSYNDTTNSFISFVTD